MVRNRKKGNGSFDQEMLDWHQRFSKRIVLKDVHRNELMDAAKQWACTNMVNGQTLCTEVHDQINHQIQGLPAQEIKKIWQLKKSQLIRDFLDAQYLDWYSMISQIAANLIRKGQHPLDAVSKACYDCLPLGHKPCLATKQENVYLEGLRLRRKRRKKLLDSGGIQMRLPWGQEAS